MRIAVIADVHGNIGALHAVIADIEAAAPDLVLHGGDLADAGASPAAVVDVIRERGWAGVAGNTDEMLFRPEALSEFASQHPQLRDLFVKVEEMASATRDALGPDRLAWLSRLPSIETVEDMALVHASPETSWRAPGVEATDTELASVFGPLGTRMAVYAHIHKPMIRSLVSLTVVNTGSVGLPYDGDRRASYLLLDDGVPRIRRVEYDVDAEIRRVLTSGQPYAPWVAHLIATATFQMP